MQSVKCKESEEAYEVRSIEGQTKGYIHCTSRTADGVRPSVLRSLPRSASPYVFLQCERSNHFSSVAACLYGYCSSRKEMLTSGRSK